jgi:hypothetical protein
MKPSIRSARMSVEVSVDCPTETSLLRQKEQPVKSGKCIKLVHVPLFPPHAADEGSCEHSAKLVMITKHDKADVTRLLGAGVNKSWRHYSPAP